MKNILIDLFKVMQRDHKLDSYKLDNVAAVFIGDTVKHYEYNEFFHGSDIQNFVRQQERDKVKADLCAKNNIKLIIIPALNKITPKELLGDILQDEINRLEINVSRIIPHEIENL